MERRQVYSGAPWESEVGYCRAIRVGAQVQVSGTTAVGADGELVGIGDAYAQAVQCLRIIQRALEEAGAKLEHVVRTRMYVVKLADWKGVARAHGEFFREIQPASTLVQVAGLISEDMLVEIEADAIISD